MKTTEARDSRISGLIGLFDMQTNFFYSVLDDISATDMHNRLDTKANHIAWLAGSLVQQRYEMAAGLLTGLEYKQTAYDLFKDNQGIKDDVTYPSAVQYMKDWENISPLLYDALLNADAEKLNSEVEIPGMKISFFELISFSIYREANHIGQMALWRRLLGYEPMKYM
jgi:hypothetical protein